LTQEARATGLINDKPGCQLAFMRSAQIDKSAQRRKVTNMDAAEISRAVATWTGWGRTTSPTRNDAVVVEEFGAARGTKLLALLRTLEEDFYTSNARIEAPDLASMGRQSSKEFRQRHPELEAEVATAFAWCYTFDFK